MIKIRLNNKDVTIKKVTVSLNENIEDVLLDYVGRLQAKYIVTNLKDKVQNKELIIVEIDKKIYQIELTNLEVTDNGSTYFWHNKQFWPILATYSFDKEIYDDLVRYGVGDVYAEKCASLLYSLEEVSEDSNEETGDTSQDEAGAETSET